MIQAVGSGFPESREMQTPAVQSCQTLSLHMGLSWQNDFGRILNFKTFLIAFPNLKNKEMSFALLNRDTAQ